MGQEAKRLDVEITKRVELDYLLYLPKGYGEDAGKKWPLILFLHGAGERGNDINLVKKHGIPRIVEEQEDFPFVAVSPQCPENDFWGRNNEALDALLNEVTTSLSVDTDRIYVTGLSMGGYGTWSLAVTYPGRFAAIAPICGGGEPRRVGTLKNVPTWVFHGAKDSVVPIEGSEKMVNALRAAGGDVRFTVYPEADHDSWTETYNNPELYRWFLSHSL